MGKKKKTGAPRRKRKTGRISVKRQSRATPENRGKTGEKRKPPIGRRFQKGQSGNPGGRPRKTKLTDATRTWLAQVDPKSGLTNAMRVTIAVGKKALRGSHEAFKALADRAEGRPAQSIELSRETVPLNPPSLTVVFAPEPDRSEMLGSSPTPATEIKPAQIEVPALAPKV
jgi:hypothetical protein